MNVELDYSEEKTLVLLIVSVFISFIGGLLIISIFISDFSLMQIA